MFKTFYLTGTWSEVYKKREVKKHPENLNKQANKKQYLAVFVSVDAFTFIQYIIFTSSVELVDKQY